MIPDRIGRMQFVRLTERWVKFDPSFYPWFCGVDMLLVCRLYGTGEKYYVRHFVSVELIESAKFDVIGARRAAMFDAMERA